MTITIDQRRQKILKDHRDRKITVVRANQLLIALNERERKEKIAEEMKTWAKRNNMVQMNTWVPAPLKEEIKAYCKDNQLKHGQFIAKAFEALKERG